MNKITKRSFYSFLTLYILSSFIFLSLASYWFYSAQLSTEMSRNYYKMSNISNQISSEVISAQMMNKKFTLKTPQGSKVALFSKNRELKYGANMQNIDFSKEYYPNGHSFTYISKNTAGHLGIEYVVVQSNECMNNVEKLKNSIVFTAIMVALLIIIIAVFLSYMFLKPIREKMQEIESFVKDTTHELNTPITALLMSTSRAKSKKVYDEKIIQNISISAKQLHDIYASLSFLSFDNSSEKAVELAFDTIVSDSLNYFTELVQKKGITVESHLEPHLLKVAPTKAKMLVNNLLSNAIKYSHPNSKIWITLNKNYFQVRDEGIGIAEEKLESIFERYSRANSYAGGFGVGLNIVDAITQEYNYKIEIESEENRGTQITIKF